MKSFFKKDELIQISNDILKWIDKDNYFLNKFILETAIHVFKKIQKPNFAIYNLLAENESIIIDKHPDEGDFIRSIALGEKAKYLKKAKNDNEYNNVISQYNEEKRKTKFNKITTTLDDKHSKMINDYWNQISKELLKHNPEEILAFFACDESILLDPEEIREEAKKNIRGSLRDMVTVNVFDINNNYKKLSDEDKLHQEILNNYTAGHNIRFYGLFVKVFFDGIVQGKLNYYSVFNFFKNHTWYGKKFEVDTKAENDKSSWLSMIAPGIHNFFSQFELSVLMNTNKVNNYILATDSLTIKFEGALRDFIRLTGGNTTTEKKGDLKEQLLEELIDNPNTVRFFSERDRALFKFTFTKNGINIRNNIAHCFFRYNSYNLQNISLIFLCLLRLGQFELNCSDS